MRHFGVLIKDIICRLLLREYDVTRVHIASPIHSAVTAPAHYALACLVPSSSIAIERDVTLIALACHIIHTMLWGLYLSRKPDIGTISYAGQGSIKMQAVPTFEQSHGQSRFRVASDDPTALLTLCGSQILNRRIDTASTFLATTPVCRQGDFC